MHTIGIYKVRITIKIAHIFNEFYLFYQFTEDGYWSSYSEWTESSVCSRSCGGGSRRMSRQRQCVGPYGGGRPCVGSSEEVKSLSCNTQACPVDGVWGPWNELSSRQSCRVTCGPGTKAQPSERKCVGPYNGGRPCTGESYIERCVEDRSYNPAPQYTATPEAPRPSYGGANAAISPRTLGNRASDSMSDSIKGEIPKPVYTSPRQPRKITSSDSGSSSLAFYDGILTPSNTQEATGKESASVSFKKPVYGAADRY